MFELRLSYRIHCREYSYVKVFGKDLLGPSKFSWLHEYFQKLESASQLKPLDKTSIHNIAQALKLLVTEKAWKSLIKKTPPNIEADDVVDVFHLLEKLLARSRHSKIAQQKISMGFRAFVKRCLHDHPDFAKEKTEILERFFRSTNFRRSPRTLISDLVLPGESVDRDPIGALRHLNVADLRAKMANRIKNSLTSIERACQYEIEEYEKTRAWLSEARQTAVLQSDRTIIEAAIGTQSKFDGKLLKALRAVKGSIVLAEYLNTIHANQEVRSTAKNGHAVHYPMSRQLVREVSISSGHEFKDFHALALYSYLGDGRVLLACLLLLLLHTGWNTSSVLELTANSVKSENGERLIQGYKRKTDDHTPIVPVSEKDFGASWALVFLLKRLDNLKRFGLVEKSAESLWLSTHNGVKAPHVHTGFRATLKEFQKRRGLPNFSLEQIRPEVIAATQIEAGEDAARRIAGHRSISTTGHYLDQLLFARLNSAINLEFQRRLELSVSWLVNAPDPADAPPNHLLHLSVPIGDGASCKDPSHPPVLDWLVEATCNAKACHRDGGCPNRVIEIDRARVDEIVSTAYFYERSWRSLADENDEAFKKIHLPAIIFNEMLRRIIRDGPYGFLLTESQERYKKEML